MKGSNSRDLRPNQQKQEKQHQQEQQQHKRQLEQQEALTTPGTAEPAETQVEGMFITVETPAIAGTSPTAETATIAETLKNAKGSNNIIDSRVLLNTKRE
jgi:hypothetical protein